MMSRSSRHGDPAHGEDFALLGLLLGRVRMTRPDAVVSSTRGPDDDPVIERVELHRKGLLGIH